MAMNETEERILGTVQHGIATGWQFMYVSARNAIRAYNRHGVTIMTIDLDTCSAAAEAAYFDLLTPYL